MTDTTQAPKTDQQLLGEIKRLRYERDGAQKAFGAFMALIPLPDVIKVTGSVNDAASYFRQVFDENYAQRWQPMGNAPTDGTKFDVLCGGFDGQVRFCDVQMRGDQSGFGYLIHTREGTVWQYLDARDDDSIMPAWTPLQWRAISYPDSPTEDKT